jgi:hypothetical protein
LDQGFSNSLRFQPRLSNSLDSAHGFSNKWIWSKAFLIVGFGPRLFWSFWTGHFGLVILDGHLGMVILDWSCWTVIFVGHFRWSFLLVILCQSFWSLKIAL